MFVDANNLVPVDAIKLVTLGPIIVKMRAMLVILPPFEDFRKINKNRVPSNLGTHMDYGDLRLCTEKRFLVSYEIFDLGLGAKPPRTPFQRQFVFLAG